MNKRRRKKELTKALSQIEDLSRIMPKVVQAIADEINKIPIVMRDVVIAVGKAARNDPKFRKALESVGYQQPISNEHSVNAPLIRPINIDLRVGGHTFPCEPTGSSIDLGKPATRDELIASMREMRDAAHRRIRGEA